MTVSSKLKISQVDREKLFFNQYIYRGIFNSRHLYWAHGVRTIEDYTHVVKDVIFEDRSWRGKVKLEEIDFELVEKIIQFKNKHSDACIYRHEGDKIAVFTNDITILQEMLSIQSDVKLTELLLSPAGVKYFKKDPPSKYRVYLKSKRITADERDSLWTFLERTDIVEGCDGLRRNLVSSSNYRNSWVHTGQFIGYNEESTLTYFSLMFPGMVGKSYKLEKKTD